MISSAAALLLCLLGCNVWRALSKSLPEHNAAAQEVTLKVQVSDVSTHQPLSNAVIEIFFNQVSLASGTTGADGTALIKLQYKLGNQLIVTATKHAYVPNSAPWRPLRLPVFSFLSLELLPERSATLMVYDDVVQIVSGYQGSRLQPQVHFARRALDLPANATYKDLAAFLTAATTLSEVDSFPYLQGSDGNSSGNSSKFDLIPVTAISIHLLNSNKTDVLVQGPIYVTVPLPADSTLKHNEHVPAWRFDQNHGAWVKSSLGVIKQEGNQLTWTYIAPQMGYWVAAMSPTVPDPVVTPDITSYHTLFLLAILGGIAFILLVLFCLLLYYCRRKCIKPRHNHRKLHLSSALDSSKKDQATSMSHINLISPVHMEMMSSSGEADIHTPMLKPSYNTSRDFSSREELLSQDEKSRMSFENLTPSGTLRQVYNKSLDQFLLKSRKSTEISDGYMSPMKDEYRRSYNSVICQPAFENKDQLSTNNVSAGSKPNLQEQSHPVPSAPETEQVMDRRPNECMMSRSVDHLERPTSFPRPGQLICFNSVDQVNDSVYRNVLPTLVIPAHYMKLQAEHPFVGQQLIMSTEQQYELERLQAELSKSHPQHPQPSSQLSSQAVSQQHLQDGEGVEWSGQNTVMSESVSIPASLNDATIAQLNGEVQLLTEKALMELGGGRPMPHPRAWFVSLDGRSNAHVRHSYIDLQRAGKNGSNDASLDSGVDMNEPKSGRKGRGEKFAVLQQQHPTLVEHQQKDQKVSDNPAYTQLVYLDDMDQSGSECGTAVCSPEDNRVFTEPPKRRSGGQLPSLKEETVKRTEDSSPVPLNSPDHEYSINDDGSDDQGENKKSPWQKREERPLLAFNMK